MFCPFMSTKDEKAECSTDCALMRTYNGQLWCSLTLIAEHSVIASTNTKTSNRYLETMQRNLK
jgi:hypothetical protein